jgi:signal transduction histidine kinase/CheY-like chemotaxis protein
MSESEIFEYLSHVQKMYSEGESRASVFNFFLQKLLTVTDSRIGFIAEILVEDTTKPDIYFHTLAESEIHNIHDTYVNITDYKKLLRHETGYCLNATDNNIFGELVKTQKYVIAGKERFEHTMYPPKHPSITSFLGIPFFYDSKMAGAIVLCNSSREYTDSLVNKLSPIQYICSILLKGFNDRSVREIYEKFVENIHIPIVLFQTRRSVPVITSFNLSTFTCVTVNNAFTKLNENSPNTLIEYKQNLVGHIFYECFPNWIDATKVHACIKEMFKKKHTISIDVMDYYDNNIPENIYTFKFIYVDANTFAVCIEPISEQLKAQKVVEDLSKTNEEFFAKIVHEFRNPLNAIINIIALMNDSNLIRQNNSESQDFRQKLQLLSSSCVTLATLSQDITDYGQLKTKRLKLSYQAFDLSKCLDFSIGMMNYEAQKKGIIIKKKIDSNVPLCIVSDPKRLRQVLVNLCSNAVKFTKRGHIGIYCKLKNILDNDIYDIEFEIEDTGRGMSEEDISNLFKPFHQLRPKEDQFSGTGLGLVISQYLVHLLGGDIRVESELGRGTKFFFTIKGKRCSMDIIESKYLPIIKNKTCLLIDSDKTSKLSILKSLLKWNVNVTSCDTIEEAELYITQMSGGGAYDIIIADRELDTIFTERQNVLYIGGNNQIDLQRPIQSDNLLQHIIKFLEDITIFSSSNHHKTCGEQSRKELTILLVEDNYINRQVELECLKTIGFKNVDIAEDGQQAIDLMKEYHYDVLLLDLKMPILDGYETYEYLLQHPSIKPFTVALTGNALDKDRNKCLEMGMDDYISKPIDMCLLKNLLDEREELLNKSKNNYMPESS